MSLYFLNMIPTTKILILISLLILSANSNAQDDICTILRKDVSTIGDRIFKVSDLLKKNKTMYEEYKDDVSKKIKVTSNILILTAKLEEASLKNLELIELCKNKGCRECQKANVN